jgi:phosphonate degradation associated HDIG domain protein
MTDPATADEPIDTLLGILSDWGAVQYGDEAVTQLQHALQCAELAEVEDGRPHLIAAALLHDIGHMVDAEGRYASDEHAETDRHHEDKAALFLSRVFGPEVTEPIRLHVPAKRYLVATDQAYADTLSAASVHSLQLQGGPMTADEVAAFEQGPYWDTAVLLRRWDDRGKNPAHRTPPLQHYRPALEAAMAAAAGR